MPVHPQPSDGQIEAILVKHNLPSGRVEASPHEGSVNYVRMVGELCVRVLKEEDFASDVYTETVAVPAVRGAGAVAPELIVFDDDRDIVPGLVSIYRRLPGEPLGQCTGPIDLPALYRAIGEQIAIWHRGVSGVDDPYDRLDKPRLDNAWSCYERNADRLDAKERAWTEAAIRRFETATAGPPSFVHWDLHAHNILVDQGHFVAVIDWGDAGWGETAVNYHCLPANMLPILLAPLGEPDPNLIGRCLYATLAYALNDVHRAGYPAQPHRNGGHARWANFQALYNEKLSAAWKIWLGDPPPHGDSAETWGVP